MRILVCDDHVVFAESLAALLTAGGREVVGVAAHPREALAVLRRTAVDICLLDVEFGPESVLAYLPDFTVAAPAARPVLLGGLVDHALVTAARAAGVYAVMAKRQPIAEIVATLDLVMSGTVVMPSTTAPAPPRAAGPAGDVHRLAAYLTSREREVLGALVCGADTVRLARRMDISMATARCHIQNVLTKMGAHSRLEAVTTAARYRVVDQETGEWLL